MIVKKEAAEIFASSWHSHGKSSAASYILLTCDERHKHWPVVNIIGIDLCWTWNTLTGDEWWTFSKLFVWIRADMLCSCRGWESLFRFKHMYLQKVEHLGSVKSVPLTSHWIFFFFFWREDPGHKHWNIDWLFQKRLGHQVNNWKSNKTVQSLRTLRHI